jgi:hypothetical protein
MVEIFVCCIDETVKDKCNADLFHKHFSLESRKKVKADVHIFHTSRLYLQVYKACQSNNALCTFGDFWSSTEQAISNTDCFPTATMVS